MNILITGGAGYVGAVLVPKILVKGYHVTVLDWYIYGKNVLQYHPHLTQIRGDIRDDKLVKHALQNIDAVIHLACISNDPSFDLNPKLGKSINYDATIQLVELSKSSGVKRFIYASSSSVYGVKKENEVTENLPLEPLTDYSKYKALCEEYMLQKNDKDFSVLILRPATVCGYSPRLRLDLTVNMLTLQALVNQKITVFGGNQLRPNIHIEDITDLYIAALKYPDQKIAGKVYNAGYQNLSLLEIAHLIKKVLHDTEIQIEISPTTDLRSYRISSQKIKKELRFVPSHTLEEAIFDLQQAYHEGKIPNAFTNDLYYNLKTLKRAHVQMNYE